MLKLSYKEQHKEMREEAYVAYSSTAHAIVAEKGSWELTLSQSERGRIMNASLSASLLLLSST